MNEEEKMALKHIKYNLDIEKKHHKHIYKGILGLYDNGSIEIILNLISNQQKEIEELNKSDASKEQSSMNYYNLYKELEDKIKAKIEELDKKYKEAYNKGFKTDMVNRLREIKLMQSLLEKE